jgi:hypothetical protein
VRQRARVRQRQTGGVQGGVELTEADAGAHPGGAPGDLDGVRQAGQDQQVAVGVGDPVERVTTAEHPDPAGTGDDLLDLGDRPRPVHAVGAELDVAGPVRQHGRLTRR